MSVRRLLQTFDDWRARGEPLVLGTVYDTVGSTYSKPGHRILIAANGDYQGLVSGGCLEGDLAERAHNVLATGAPAAVTYDLRNEADELFGLGVGCNGLIRVFLQPLLAADGYEPFAALAQAFLGGEKCATAVVIESETHGAPAGATLLSSATAQHSFRLAPVVAAQLAARSSEMLRAGGRARYSRDEPGLAVLYAPLEPVPQLLVLGAGLDAIPLVGMAADLGWRVTVVDHRPAYLQRGGFERAERALLVQPDALSDYLALDDFAAVIVMSHHLATDRKYLRQLASARAPYLGILGPAERRERLLAELAESGLALHARLRGPVGLDIGADSPESIALSILAEMQATFAGIAAKTIRTS
jgi:xanthine/CO dehydrogenase XdhC/CoxF family maturation factor